MSKHDHTTCIKESFERDVDQEEATKEFLDRTQSLLDEIRSGKRTLKHALSAIVTEVTDEDLKSDKMDEATRTAIQAGGRSAGNEEILGVGPPHAVMELVSRLPEMLSDGLVAEHEAECDLGDQCVFSDPKIAPYIGTLRAMAMVLSRVVGSGPNAARFIHRALNEMTEKAVALAEAKAALPAGMQEGAEGHLFALGGEKAKKFVKSLLEAGLLPDELADKLRKELAKEEEAVDATPPEDMDAKCTFVPNGPSTKH